MRKSVSGTSRAWMAGVAAAGLAVLAACGGSSNGEGGAATSPTGAAASPGAGASEQVQAAQALVDKYKQEPTKINVTEPLKSKPPTGKLFVWLKCDVSQCTDEGDGIREATQAIGWQYREINYKSADPATLNSALRQALQLRPTAVGLSGIPQAAWQSMANAYKSANIPIVTGYVGPQSYSPPVIGQVGGNPDVTDYGKMIGSWFIADSKGQGRAVLLSINDFPVLKTFSTSFKDTVSSGCSDCKVTEVNVTIPDVFAGKTVPPLISAIQKDKSINYVITSNGPFIAGINSALAAAGRNDVKIAGESGDTNNLTLVKQGKQHAFTGLALHYSGWLFVDIALRHLEGMSFDPDGDGGLPKQLLTPDVKFDISTSYDKPTDFREQFKKLWLVG